MNKRDEIHTLKTAVIKLQRDVIGLKKVISEQCRLSDHFITNQLKGKKCTFVKNGTRYTQKIKSCMYGWSEDWEYFAPFYINTKSFKRIPIEGS